MNSVASMPTIRALTTERTAWRYRTRPTPGFSGSASPVLASKRHGRHFGPGIDSERSSSQDLVGLEAQHEFGPEYGIARCPERPVFERDFETAHETASRVPIVTPCRFSAGVSSKNRPTSSHPTASTSTPSGVVRQATGFTLVVIPQRPVVARHFRIIIGELG